MQQAVFVLHADEPCRTRLRRPLGFVELVRGKVRTAALADLASLDQAVHRAKRIGNRHTRIGLMQLVEIDVIGAKALQAPFASGQRAGVARVRREHFGHEVEVVAPARDRAPDDLLGPAITVHLRRVDQARAEIEAERQRGDLLRAGRGVLPHAPRPQSEAGHRRAGGLHRAGRDAPPGPAQ